MAVTEASSATESSDSAMKATFSPTISPCTSICGAMTNTLRPSAFSASMVRRFSSALSAALTSRLERKPLPETVTAKDTLPSVPAGKVTGVETDSCV